MRWTHGMRARLALLFRGTAEARMDEEIRFHLEMEAEKNVRAGMSPAEARRRARLDFGAVEAHREAMRDGRTLAWAGGLSLDLRLGTRMLARYPGLTAVGGLATAFAIWVGAGTFEFLRQAAYPTLPLPDGDRIVAIRPWDAEANRSVASFPADLAAWREMRTVEEMGAFRTGQRNLIAPGLPVRPVDVTEMSAAGFRVARTAPLVGRALAEEDERPGAPAVAVLGHELWQTRFGGDPAVVGREIRLGSTVHVVVGVMPEGFGFPLAQQLWTPLPAALREMPPGEGPEVRVFGRLAEGATLREARAELATLAGRAAADAPETHRRLRPRLRPYAESFMELTAAGSMLVMAMNLFVVMLLLLVCGNVALLMFARAVSREDEIAVRTALGASRGRIAAQLVAEALVLAGLGAVVGLAATELGLRWLIGALESQITSPARLPFWIRDRLSPSTVLYAAGLTLLGAVVAGVLPARKVTRGLTARLRRASAGGGGYRFGGVWTAVIVAQVAVTVAFPAGAFFLQREAARGQSRDVGVATEAFLSVRLEADAEAAPSAADAARARASVAELERRLEADPAVAGVTFAADLPRMNHPDRRIELDAGGAAPVDPRLGHRWVATTSVAPDYFAVLGAPVVRGRGFHAGDLAPGARAVVVNESFVARVLGGRNPIGRHLRYLSPDRASAPAEAEPWYEIVGVVPDLGMAVEPEGVYHPAAPGAAWPMHMAVRARGRPEALVPRVRALAVAVDPGLRLHQPVPLDRVGEDRLIAFWFWLTVGVSAVALLLSLAGIYAVMSFTVARRTREIGIRVALGADARRLAAEIFRRPLAQVAGGIAAGAALVAALPAVLDMEAVSARGAAMVAGYALFMTAVCLLACVVPTRRALRIQPREALQAD